MLPLKQIGKDNNYDFEQCGDVVAQNDLVSDISMFFVHVIGTLHIMFLHLRCKSHKKQRRFLGIGLSSATICFPISFVATPPPFQKKR